VIAMADFPTPTLLQDRHVVLRPTEAADADDLYAALRDPEIWTWLSALPPADAEIMRSYVRAALHERDLGLRWPWTVRVADSGEVAGWTSYGTSDVAQGRIEIGWTAYGVRFQRTAVNTATKLLLIGHAFDDLGFDRVEFKTDLRNERSQAAIARIGAMREGVLRSHQFRADGSRRDSVMFSIIRSEWPAVRAALVGRLAR
jgi:RimJ/RimL family protein N-acetyltransferase